MGMSHLTTVDGLNRLAKEILEHTYAGPNDWHVEITRRKDVVEGPSDQYFVKPGDTLNWGTGNLEVGVGRRKTEWHSTHGGMDKMSDAMSMAKRDDPGSVPARKTKMSEELGSLESKDPKDDRIDRETSQRIQNHNKLLTDREDDKIPYFV